MQGLLPGKIAVIPGAGSGVGRAACLIFARNGASVACADIDAAAARETAELVKAEGHAALAAGCDVGDAAQVDALVAAAVAAWGRLDVIYNNAGITIIPKADGSGRGFLATQRSDVDRVFDVNVFGVMNGCLAAVRQFEAQAADGRGSGGVIVNTASVAGLIGYGNVAYGATKGAITALTRTLAIEMAPAGIRVNSVCPAGMPTNFLPGIAHSEAAHASMSASHPLGRPIAPEDCANAALLLASDLAANITGVNLPVDGGLSAGISTARKG
ncbi:MAG: SDR family oxidoreductase [Sphingomonadales bacterium]|nr:SDR family oxidoreductase [Sphingomonadales bacterium]